MTVRIYWSPIIGDGLSPATRYRAKAATKAHNGYATTIRAQAKYTADGDLNPSYPAPVFGHTLVIVAANDWAEFDADAEEIQLTPDLNVQTRQELLAAIKGRTVSSIPPAYRSAWSNALTEVGAATADIIGDTPLARVLRRLMYFLDPCGSDEDGIFG